jgi:hypothetical protein
MSFLLYLKRNWQAWRPEFKLQYFHNNKEKKAEKLAAQKHQQTQTPPYKTNQANKNKILSL